MSVSSIASTARVPGPESYREKFVRRFKEEPLVPIGAAATTVALIIASTKIGKKDQSKSLNTWLRLRVVAQGFTIAAIVAGSYVYGNTKQQKDARAEADATTAEENRLRDRAEFEERLRAAEEAHAMESVLSQRVDEGKGVWGKLGLGKSESLTSQDATGVPSSAALNSQQPTPPETVVYTPASEKVNSSSGGVWSWLGWSSSGDKKA